MEVWTPIEGMSSRTGGEPGRIGPGRPAWPGEGAAGAGGGASERVDGAGLVGGAAAVAVAVGAGDAGAAAAAGGCGGAGGAQPQGEQDPGEENQHDGGRRGEDYSAAATVLGGPVHQLRARARRAVRVPEPAATSSRPPPSAIRPVLVGLEAPPAPVAAPPAGAAMSAPQTAGSVASVGRLGSRSLFVLPSYLPSLLWSTPWMTTTDSPVGDRLGDVARDL